MREREVFGRHWEKNSESVRIVVVVVEDFVTINVSLLVDLALSIAVFFAEQIFHKCYRSWTMLRRIISRS